jgi:hypothetical protein
MLLRVSLVSRKIRPFRSITISWQSFTGFVGPSTPHELFTLYVKSPCPMTGPLLLDARMMLKGFAHPMPMAEIDA